MGKPSEDSLDGYKKTRQTSSAQTRDTPLGRRVTSQSDMKVTPQRRTYTRSSLKKSCYVKRHSVEGGATPIINPLVLAYHFGQASATPDRKRATKITKHPPHPPGRNHVVNEEGADNVMLEASFRDGRDAHSREREGEARKTEARPTPSRREGRGSADYKTNLKSPQTRGSPGVFFAREDKISSQGEVQKTKPGVDRSSSEGVLTTTFGARGGVSLMKLFFKPPQTGGSPGNF